MTTCATCPFVAGRVPAVNEVGIEIQEFHLPAGWVAPAHLQFSSCCAATAALAQLPADGVERRLYPTLTTKDQI